MEHPTLITKRKKKECKFKFKENLTFQTLGLRKVCLVVKFDLVRHSVIKKKKPEINELRCIDAIALSMLFFGPIIFHSTLYDNDDNDLGGTEMFSLTASVIVERLNVTLKKQLKKNVVHEIGRTNSLLLCVRF